MKKLARLVASLILAGAMAAPAFAGFEFHGYGRAGVLLNSEGAKAQLGAKDGGVIAPNAPAKSFLHNIGRLGNETNNYVEMEFTNTFKAGTVGAATKVRLAAKDEAYTSSPKTGGTTNVPDGNGGTVTVSTGDEAGVFVRELYTEFYGLPFAPKSTVWAGKRFYGRDDIHINDFYFRIMDGTEAGIMNVPAGPGSLDIAWINATNSNTGDFPVIAEKGQLVQQNLDVRYKGIKALGGEFEVEGAVASVTDEKAAGNADSGMQLAALYSRADFFGVVPGNSKVVFQYGTGLSAGLGNAAGPWFYKDAEAMRLIAWGVANVTDKLKVSPSLVYQTADELYGAKNPDGYDWLSFTVRPQYNFTRNLALQAEFGYETGYTWNGDGSVMKLTVAPTITLDDTSFWTRPQLRAFVTVGAWDKDLTKGWNAVTNDPSSDKDGITTYGVQMEAWW